MKPNVLFIMVDQWGSSLLREADNNSILTPTLDRLSRMGIRYSNAYSVCPTCIPARRSLMTGTSAKTHGDRNFNETLEMNKNLPTMVQVFSENGYQTFGVGKFHVYPQRDRIGFDEIILNEEQRHHLGMIKDDYEIYLSDLGFNGEELTHGMGNNMYETRPWHLPGKAHPTYWTTKQMCRTIKRRDKRKPSFWFCSYNAPHPPVTPISEYLKMYDDIDIDLPKIGEWAKDIKKMPYTLRKIIKRDFGMKNDIEIKNSIKAFYAQCTYVDHQIRLLLGTLREEGVLDNTIIVFTSDHGDMLGNHKLWAKGLMYESANKIPLVIVPSKNDKACEMVKVDNRLAELRDLMPTLLDMCNINIPKTVEGNSLFAHDKRVYLYGEHYEDERASRMIRKDDYKLIYYPIGNIIQFFNVKEDEFENIDLSNDDYYRELINEYKLLLIENMYGSDERYIKNNKLVGLPDKKVEKVIDRGFLAQRGWRI